MKFRICSLISLFVSGQSHFVLTPSPLWNKTWNIQTIQPLNRDVLRVSPIDQPPYGMGQRITVGVTCYVTNPQGTERTISKNITVNVLDEDDNPLVSQENDTIHVPVNKGLMINVSLIIVTYVGIRGKIIIGVNPLLSPIKMLSLSVFLELLRYVVRSYFYRTIFYRSINKNQTPKRKTEKGTWKSVKVVEINLPTYIYCREFY